jgi:hypothetical protein
VREKEFDITEEEYERVKQCTRLSDLSQKRLSERDLQIRQCEDYLSQLMAEL